jgi:hypothetical protein
LQVGDTGPVESARRSNSRVLGSPFSGLSGQHEYELIQRRNGEPCRICLKVLHSEMDPAEIRSIPFDGRH